jgi:hypothetical protein
MLIIPFGEGSKKPNVFRFISLSHPIVYRIDENRKVQMCEKAPIFDQLCCKTAMATPRHLFAAKDCHQMQ